MFKLRKDPRWIYLFKETEIQFELTLPASKNLSPGRLTGCRNSNKWVSVPSVYKSAVAFVQCKYAAKQYFKLWLPSNKMKHAWRSLVHTSLYLIFRRDIPARYSCEVVNSHPSEHRKLSVSIWVSRPRPELCNRGWWWQHTLVYWHWLMSNNKPQCLVIRQIE